jgi:hypothetical protein
MHLLSLWGLVLGHPRDTKEHKKQRGLIIAIPLIALVIIAAVYIVSVLPNQGATPAMNFTDQLLVEVNNATASANGYVTPVTTINGQRVPISLGEPGGLWETHQYDGYGLGGYYPLYMDNSYYACPAQRACTFHVKSTNVVNYTLSDFMAVWGYPTVSPSNTLGVKTSGNYTWELCIGPPGSAVPNLAWGTMVLSPNLDITLIYYNQFNGFGCA